VKTGSLARLKRIFEVYRPLHRALALSVALDALSQVAALIAPFLSGKIIDGIIAGKGLSELIWPIGAIFVSMEARGAVYFVLDWNYLKRICFNNGEIASDTTINGVSKLSIGQVVNHNSGFKHDVIKKGEWALADTSNLLLTQVISLVLRVLISSLAMFFVSRTMGWVVVAAVGTYVASSFIINKKLQPEVRRHSRLESKLGTVYWEHIKNLRLVMVNNQEKRMKTELALKEKQCNDVGRALWIRYVALIHTLREPFSHLGQIGVIVVGVYLASTGQATAGSVVIALGFSAQAFTALGSVGSLQRQLSKNNVLIGRYFDLIDMPPAIRVAKEPVRPKRFRGEIEFRDVSFSYPKHQISKDPYAEDDEKASPGEHHVAVKNLSFRIPAGATCAFVGPSGSGKSTAVHLILRAYDPGSGQILVDGCDLSLLDLGLWRKAVGTVEQDPKLWDETVRYNLTYSLNGAAKDVTDADLDRIAKIARIDEFYQRLGAKPFETVIGENGVQLSGGQRQRIAIGRALMKEPSLMILDEATNALDPENESLVHQAMHGAMKGRTCIVIAHRLSTIRHADQIVVFKAGGIAGIGNHAELMKSCAEYRSLVTREVSMLS
jgi:ATP-binding cassette subfamily B protein